MTQVNGETDISDQDFSRPLKSTLLSINLKFIT